jgi:opacity protein-like surface antigen
VPRLDRVLPRRRRPTRSARARPDRARAPREVLREVRRAGTHEARCPCHRRVGAAPDDRRGAAASAALAPSLAAEPSREEPFAKRWRAALLFGPELVDDQAGMKMRADVETDLLPLSARSVLSWVLSASAAYRGDEATASLAGVSTTATATSVMFELVPSLRARLAVTPALSIYADAGLGGAFSTSKLETKTDVSGLVTRTSSSSSAAGMVLRCGLGAGYAVSERASVAVELFGLNAHYGDTRGRSVTVLAGLTYQL